MLIKSKRAFAGYRRAGRRFRCQLTEEGYLQEDQEDESRHTAGADAAIAEDFQHPLAAAAGKGHQPYHIAVGVEAAGPGRTRRRRPGPTGQRRQGKTTPNRAPPKAGR